jgi:serine/threonine protein kinase/uncharacterized protein
MINSPDNRNALPIGYQLGDYQIQRLLGDGGFGITYLAIDMRLNSKVAIKEYFPNELAIRETNRSVHPKSQRDSQDFMWGLQRFLEEAQTLAKFKHFNIVRVLRFFEANHTAYIVMEYEQGESLASALEDGNTATEHELLSIMRPLLDGLATIHQAGVLHRDIKPANIYLRHKDNSPVLLDFGSARYDVGSRSRSVTSIVTPGYAPLEQYETKGHQGAWTDIYALGAVMYRAIGGDRPVEATERAGAILRAKADPLTPAVEIGRGRYSRHLLEAIDWALKVNEDDRPSSVEAWRAKLLAMAARPTSRQERSPSSPSEQPTERITSRPDSGWQPRRVLAVGVALLLAIMVGGLMYYFIDSQAQARRQAEVEAKLAAAEQARRQAEVEAKLAAAERTRLQAETRLAEARAAAEQLRLEHQAAQARSAAEQRRLETKAAQAAAEQARREREIAEAIAFAQEIARRQAEARRVRETERQSRSVAATATQPPWCPRASTRTERLICNSDDTELWALDNQIRALYRQLKTPGQRQWLRNVRDRCSEVYCLKRVYRERIAEMGRLSTMQTITPTATQPPWCPRASTRTERLICNSDDTELWALENQMRALYRQVKTPGQRQWLRNVRDRCSEIYCLKRVYRERITEMGGSFQ